MPIDEDTAVNPVLPVEAWKATSVYGRRGREGQGSIPSSPREFREKDAEARIEEGQRRPVGEKDQHHTEGVRTEGEIWTKEGEKPS